MDGEMQQRKELRILALEDSADDASLMEQALRRGGLAFSLRRVWTREDFLREFEDFHPDLIISDYTLPSYDGLTALGDIRKKDTQVPYIFLSGTIGEEFAIDTLKRGATDYVLKDRISRLVPAVNRALRESEEHRERQKAEESLRESEGKFKGLAASAQDAIIMIDGNGHISYWNESAERMFGYSFGEVRGREMHALIAPSRLAEAYRRGFQDFSKTGEGPFLGRLLTLSAVRKDGAEFPVEFSVSALQLKGEWHAISILRDITERKKTEEMLQRQLENMIALRDIEIAIGSSLDLRVTLNVVLEKLTSLLGVDAAAVLLLDQGSLYLNHAAGRGFRTSAVQSTHVRIGKGHAGQAAYERQPLIIMNLSEALTTRALQGEKFNSYIAMPLIAHGKVKGVLEIFQRKMLNPSPEWMNFLELLAGQAAVAIDNASMFDSVQRFATDLTLSYDATLEGWGRTLEFRDHDTKGHTERVTEMTMRLARLLGMEEQELVQVRRGALLHDIGKISIPDSILLKRGQLSAEENEIMKLHPVYARQLLESIPFLRPAIDIPYCHHERWDGNGYPRGIKGEEIPFKARVFAVIDVADALISDRPYRPGWTIEKTYKHIASLKGVNFDPMVVDAFLNMKWELQAPAC
jgi:PAS domain S-box-containing protein